jgi:hypothetical protein
MLNRIDSGQREFHGRKLEQVIAIEVATCWPNCVCVTARRSECERVFNCVRPRYSPDLNRR